MELLEGETLAARIERGPLKIDEALRVAEEIASALAVAHRAGIVHRDLKPGNVMLTRAGAKVLDFGIAKLAEPGAAAPGHLPTAIQTRTAPLTAKGALVGTLNYMAPEQLEGRTVDHRADIFAFGAVLYEMLTGRRAFEGASQASVIAAILERDPAPAVSLVPALPPALDRLVRECLAKDPEARRQSAQDVAAELRGIAASPATTPGTAAGSAARPRSSSRAAWAAAAGALVLAAVFAVLWMRRPEPPARVTEIVVPLRGAAPGYANPAAVSPDQESVAYVDMEEGGEVGQLWVRRLDDAEPRRVEGAVRPRLPFWSPDGREIAYFTGSRLMAVFAAGGSARALCDASYGVGGTWSRQGTILFSSAFNEGLKRVDATGGRPEAVTTLDASRGESGHVWPVFLPDGRRFLFLSRTIAEESNRIEMASLDGGPRKVVMEADALIGYASPWLLFVQHGVVFAQRFDPEAGSVSGPRRTAIENAWYSETWAAASATVVGDTLVRATPPRVRVIGEWFDARGERAGPAFEDENVSEVRLSPDGGRVLLSKRDATRGADDLWVLDLARTIRTRLTNTAGDEDAGCWFPDGSEVVYESDAPGPYSLFRVAADGSAEPRLVLKEIGHDWAASAVSPDGRTLYARRTTAESSSDIWSVPLDAPDTRTPWLASADWEDGARPSPDGRWIAYESSRSGTLEVFLRDVGGAAIIQVSVNGGSAPRWDPDGRSILFAAPDGHILRVPLRVEAGRIVPSAPDRASAIEAEDLVSYDVAADGRVLVLRRARGTRDQYVIRIGWQERLR